MYQYLPYPLQDVILILLALHEETDLPAGSRRVSIHFPAVRVVNQGEVTDVEGLSSTTGGKDDLVPNVDLGMRKSGQGN